MEGLGMSFKKMYINQIRTRYLSADKISKSRILDEYCNICGYNHKHAIRAINTSFEQASQKLKTGPKPKYPQEQLLEPLELAARLLKRCGLEVEDFNPFYFKEHIDKQLETIVKIIKTSKAPGPMH